ncbi:TfoX/Sxy family DNA transformation protein [Vibrio sp.]|uniref:TfoX/Sxy family DNA transformation protein n=1 Tax=Vibrio viridaestus TaxID=2487322 RepID=A0A3N9TYD8_9VIBR|nr:TfoX/Sxy family DNA transformation protein [Vibrio viridaestus]MDC0609474.1 TfoX/Sxy family DNA transformation protein [Vibrio sp.]RQW61952.1 TfoX/Sxy family DNA transformation protein [Vibrio viridaestus]
MKKPILLDSMRLFEPLGEVKSRSMFGGFGIFVDDTMFALVVNDQLHIRADQKSKKQFSDNGLEPYVYSKKGFPVVTKYFALPDNYWESPQNIYHMGEAALSFAKDEKKQQSQTKPQRLKDLPNLRLSIERMLKKAGIKTVDELIEQGSVRAYRAIKDTSPSDPSLELLWALEGAIEGIHWSVITQDRRDELTKSL